MKKQAKIFIVLAVLFGCVEVSTAQVRHYLGLWAHAGEYSFVPNYEGMGETGDPLMLKTSLGGGGGLGFTYEMRAGQHFLLDLGVGANTAYTRFKVLDKDYALYNQMDTENEIFNYVYEVRDRRDAYHTTSLQVPVMLGAQFGRFYFLAGAKLDMALLVNTKVRATVNTVGRYKQYIEPVRNVPTQGFYEGMELQQPGKIAFLPNVTASAEIGGYLTPVYSARGFDVPNQKIQCRLALFADYGILDAHKPGNKLLMQTTSGFSMDAPLESLRSTDIMSSVGVADQNTRFNSLMIGLKCTVLFRMPDKRICVMCRESRFHNTHRLTE